jgi:tetratricopeptide (TPR) repeat protein
MLEKNPQEAAYRKGVKCFLQGKHERAIQYFDEAITINPEDARSYLFRGMVYALQSQKGGLFGPSSSAKEISKAKFESDLQRALALSKDNEVVKRACSRAKYWLVDYAKQIADARAQHAREEKNPLRLAGSLAFGIFSVFAFLLGSIWMIVGVRAVVEYAFYARLSLTSGVSFMVLGALVLFGGFSIYRRKRKRGIILIIAGILILFILVALEIL